jgi:hypothetical protein
MVGKDYRGTRPGYDLYVTRADVIRTLGNGRSLTSGSAPWTLRFLDKADQQFGGEWHSRTLTGREALEILLPPHAGEPCKGDRLTLVDPAGATVRDAARRLAQFRENYQAANPSCWSRIEEAALAPFSGIILTPAPLDHDDYRGLEPEPGRLYHLDGFHRLVGWAWAGRLSGTAVRVPALIAGGL